MKKITIVLFAFFITTSVAHASVFNMGPRIGGSISQLNVDLAKESKEYKLLNLKAGLGYHVGVFTRFSFGALYVQPELLFSGAGAKINKKSKETKLRFTKVDLPIMAGLSFFNIVRAQIGPTFSMLLNAVEDGATVKENYSKATFGWQTGLGVDIWNMTIDLKYEGNLSKFGDKIAGFTTKQGYGLWILSVGFNIF